MKETNKIFFELNQSMLCFLLVVVSTLGSCVGRVGCVKPKIIGGWHVSIEDAPFHVSISHWEHCRIRKLGRWTHSCEGSIVNEWWILTAAHCITDYIVTRNQIERPPMAPKELVVAVARDSKDYRKQWLENIFLEVDLVVPHPLYFSNGSYSRKDIGLLRLLNGPLVWSEIQPAVLPSGSYVPQEYTQACVAGFGKVDPEDELKDNRLKAHCAYIYLHAYCADIAGYVPESINSSIPPSIYCWVARYYYTGFPYTRICNADSGSGLTKKLANGSFLIVGVAARAAVDCEIGEEIFSSVSSVEPWVRSVIAKVPLERE